MEAVISALDKMAQQNWVDASRLVHAKPSAHSAGLALLCRIRLGDLTAASAAMDALSSMPSSDAPASLDDLVRPAVAEFVLATASLFPAFIESILNRFELAHSQLDGVPPALLRDLVLAATRLRHRTPPQSNQVEPSSISLATAAMDISDPASPSGDTFDELAQLYVKLSGLQPLALRELQLMHGATEVKQHFMDVLLRTVPSIVGMGAPRTANRNRNLFLFGRSGLIWPWTLL